MRHQSTLDHSLPRSHISSRGFCIVGPWLVSADCAGNSALERASDDSAVEHWSTGAVMVTDVGPSGVFPWGGSTVTLDSHELLLVVPPSVMQKNSLAGLKPASPSGFSASIRSCSSEAGCRTAGIAPGPSVG